MNRFVHFLHRRLVGGPLAGAARRSSHRAYSQQAQEAFGKSLSSDFPRNMDIELTNACNLQCPMCPRTDIMTRDIGLIDPGLMKKIMDEIERHGLHRLYLHVFGEAILHPKWPFLIRDARRNSVRKVELSVNGVLLTEEKCRQLLDTPLDGLYLSIDSVNESLYDEVRAGGDLQRLLANVKTLIAMHREMRSSMRMELQVIDFPQFRDNVRDFVEYFMPFLSENGPDGVSIRVKSYIDYAGQVAYAQKHRNLHFETPCTWTTDRCTVHWNGDVVACCMDVNGTIKLGNVIDSSLADIWHSEAYTRLRQAHLDLDLERYPLCRNCEIRMKEWPTGRSVHGEPSTFFRTKREADTFLRTYRPPVFESSDSSGSRRRADGGMVDMASPTEERREGHAGAVSRVPLKEKPWYAEVCEFYNLPIADVRTSAIDASPYLKYPRIRQKRLQAIDRLCSRFGPRPTAGRSPDREKSLSWKQHFMSCIWSEKSGRRRLEFLAKMVRCADEVANHHLGPADRSPMRVLDFGCGTSLFGRLLTETHPNFELLLCDMNGFHFRFAAHRTQVFSPNVFLFPVEDPFRNCPDFGVLDFVYCFTVFEHLPNTTDVIKHLVNGLSPRGVLVETYSGHPSIKPHKGDTVSSYLARDSNLDYLRSELVLAWGSLPEKGGDGSYSQGGQTRLWMKPASNERLRSAIRSIMSAEVRRDLRLKISSRFQTLLDAAWAYSHFFLDH